MANSVYHTGYGIEINLTRPDLGHPDRPGLWREIYGEDADPDPRLLQCMANWRGLPCDSEAESKSPWMYIRLQNVNGARTPVAVHRNHGEHLVTIAELDQHKALKERIWQDAQSAGFEADVGGRSPDGRRRTDVIVRGEGGIRIGWEPQMSPLTAGAVRRRSRLAEHAGVTPMWLTKSDQHELVDRAPWSRIRETPWRAIAAGEPLQIVGGVKSLDRWRCDDRAPMPCPGSGRGRCGAWHGRWVSTRNVLLRDLVESTAAGEYRTLHMPKIRGRRREHYLWVAGAELELYRELRQDVVSVDDREPEALTEAELAARELAREAAERAASPIRPPVELIAPESVLDWRASEHWNPVPARCVYCQRLCHLLDETGRPAHKACAEEHLRL